MRVRDLGAEGAEGLLVHVRGARPEDAAARQRHLGSAEPSEQRPDEIERGRELPHEGVGGGMLGDVRRVDRDGSRTLRTQARAERFEELPHDGDVRDVRDAVAT